MSFNVSHLLLVAAFVASTASATQSSLSFAGRHGVMSGEVRALLVAYSVQAFEQRLESWSELPSYLKVSTLETLADLVLLDPPCNTSKYEWKPPGHDLNRGAGRAATAIEHLLSVELPRITPQTTPAEAADVHQEAKLYIDLYRQGIISAGLEYGTEATVDELRGKYSENITPGITGTDAHKSISAMKELLTRWFPLGKDIGQLSEIIGEDGELTEYGAVFSFDSGFIIRRYHVFVDGGLIQSVVIQ